MNDQNQQLTVIEERLAQVGAGTIEMVNALLVTSDAAYEAAGTMLREIKTRSNQVKEFWADPKAKAKAAHQGICDKEKAMLAPYTEAESTLKARMAEYQRQVEATRRKAEAEARRRQQAEAERLLAEAVQADSSGDEVGATVNMAMAQMVEDMAPTPIMSAAPRAVGVGTRKTWKARITDASKVPIEAMGAMIRPIDMAALNQIAKLTKGSATIPGVEFFEDIGIAVRAG